MYPQMDDTIWFTPSPETANVVTVQPLFASAAYYVNPDPDVGSNDNDGLSAETPFATLQKAMSKCSTSERSVIYAADGDQRFIHEFISFSRKHIGRSLIRVRG